jgi:CCR4-NOT transcription complex subunit 4
LNALGSSQKRLEDARIIQRTLVYIINLPASVSDENTIASPLYFGKYGRITKIHITSGHHNSQDLTFGAYITYSTEEEAAVCIKTCHEHFLDGKKLTVTFGTTKYCSYFLKNSRCPKNDCVFLHDLASDADTIFREEMVNSKHIQPQDSIFDRLKVIKIPPAFPSKLPEFNIVHKELEFIVEITAAQVDIIL